MLMGLAWIASFLAVLTAMATFQYAQHVQKDIFISTTQRQHANSRTTEVQDNCRLV